MDYEEAKVSQKIDQKEIKRIMDSFMNEYMRTFQNRIKI